MAGFIEGQSREQTTLFPESLDEYIAEDNPVRFIDAFVDTLDFEGMGFAHAVPEATGRPPYDPGDLVKLYVYGYLNRLRSSRGLERECHRNVELMWLLRRLAPDFKTIADFRRDNGRALREVCRQFTLLCREMQLFGGHLVAIDGSRFQAVNSKRRNYSARKLRQAIREADAAIDQYLKALDDGDRDEPDEPAPNAQELQEKIEKLRRRKAEDQAKLRAMRRRGEQQVSLTDPDSRRMSHGRGSTVGYNVQTAVDARYSLIVSHQVTNQVTDQGLLSPMAKAAKEALGKPRLQVTADRGYYAVAEVKECLAHGIRPYMPRPNTSANTKLGLFGKTDFRWDPGRRCYWCPAGKKLTYRSTTEEKGRVIDYYVASGCQSCRLLSRCTRSQENRRISRHIDERLLEDMAKRVQAEPEKVRRRKAIVEHPFGTIKAAMGCGSFLTRGLDNVRTEMSLTVLAYNLKRVFNILGTRGMMEAIG